MRDGLREVESAASGARQEIVGITDRPLYQGLMRLGGPVGNLMFRFKGLVDTTKFFGERLTKNTKEQVKNNKSLEESFKILKLLYGQQHAMKMLASETNKVKKEELELLAKEVGGKGQLFRAHEQEMKFLEKRYIKLRETGQLEKAGRVLSKMGETRDAAREAGLIDSEGRKNVGFRAAFRKGGTVDQKLAQKYYSLQLKITTLQKRAFNFLASLPLRTVSLVFRGLAKLVIVGLIGFGLIVAAIYLFRKPLMEAFKDTAKLKKRVEKLKNTLVEFYDSYLRPVVEAGVKLFKALADPTKTANDVLGMFGDFILTGLANLAAFTIQEVLPRLAEFLPKILAFLMAGVAKFIGWFTTFDWVGFFEKFKLQFSNSLKAAGLNKDSAGYKSAMAAFSAIMNIARFVVGLALVVVGIGGLIKGAIMTLGALITVFTDRKNFGTHMASAGQQVVNSTATLGKGSATMMGLQGLATGGTITRSGAFLVGERGPELVNLPKGSAVTPNGGGNTIHVHVNGRLGASENELRDIARRVGQMVSREMNRSTSTGVRL